MTATRRKGGPGWTAEKQKARYHRLKAEGRCVRCQALKLPEWPAGVHCPVCKEATVDHSRKYRHTDKGRAFVKRTNAKRRATPGWREQENERAREHRLNRKLDGICRYCPLPCLDDSVFCEEHRERSRRQTREHMRRKRLGLQAPRRKKAKILKFRPINRIEVEPEIETTTPIADYENGDMSLSAAAVRYVQLCNGITAADVREAFGIDADNDDGNVAHSLLRGTKRGDILAEQTPEGRIYYPNRKNRRAA
jgi:hypothetical protein